MSKFIKLIPAITLLAGVIAGCSSTPPPQQNLAAASPSPIASPSPEVTPEASPIAEQPQVAAGTGSRVSPPANRGGSGGVAPSRPGSGSNSGGGYGPAPAPAPKQPVVRNVTYTIPAGTSISVSPETDISTKSFKNGDSFTASLSENLIDNGYVIARAGARVTGTVTESDPGGRVKGKALISVTLRSIQLADGGNANIQTSQYTKEAKGSKKKDAAKVGIGAGIGAAIGAIAGGGKGAAIGAGVGGGAGAGAVLATRGEAAVIPAEANINVTLSSPISVTRRQ